MRRLLILAAATAALALVPVASAGTVSKLKSGDAAFVKGTDLGCAISSSDGKLAVACFRMTAAGPKPSSYAVGLRADHVAVLEHLDAAGKVTIVRKLQAKAKTLQLGAGDGFTIQGSDLGCVVAGTAITCFHFNAKGTVPKSYGIVLNDKYASVVKYDAAGKASTVATKLQG